MTEPTINDPEMLRRQVLGHLQSLRAAGVDLLPKGAPVTLSFAIIVASNKCTQEQRRQQPIASARD